MASGQGGNRSSAKKKTGTSGRRTAIPQGSFPRPWSIPRSPSSVPRSLPWRSYSVRTPTKYEHVLPQLAAIEDSRDIDGVLILLNTMGGDVEAGLAIAEMIASISKPTISLVLGGSHSIGVPISHPV